MYTRPSPRDLKARVRGYGRGGGEKVFVGGDGGRKCGGGEELLGMNTIDENFINLRVPTLQAAGDIRSEGI